MTTNIFHGRTQFGGFDELCGGVFRLIEPPVVVAIIAILAAIWLALAFNI